MCECNKNRQRISWWWIPSVFFSDGLTTMIILVVPLLLYKQLGLSNGEITFYISWLYLPWVLRPIWREFIIRSRIQRGLLLILEIILGASLGGVAFSIPTASWLQNTLFFFWVMAFSASTFELTANDLFELVHHEHEWVHYDFIRNTFYWLATIFGQGVLVMIVGNLQVVFRNNIAYSWSLLFYGIMGLFLALWLWHSYVLPRPAEDAPRKGVTAGTIFNDFIATLKTFFQKEQVLIGILFMLLYRMPEGLLAKVSSLFLIDAAHNGGLGLSPQEYGFVQGTVGVIGLTLGGILGGMVASKDGLKKWLWPMVCAITLPDIVYVYLAYVMPSELLTINICVFFEQFGYGFGFTAYMLYLIYYSRGEYKTSHYALCTAFMALSMMIPGLFAGALQELVGYRIFFIIVMLFCSVTFITTALLHIDPDFGKKAE